MVPKKMCSADTSYVSKEILYVVFVQEYVEAIKEGKTSKCGLMVKIDHLM
jgi:hypothetical protein